MSKEKLCQQRNWQKPCPEICGEMCNLWLSDKCLLAENDMSKEIKTKANTKLCTCGRVFNDDVDYSEYDTLGSDSGICCPDCGNEKFKSVAELEAELAAIKTMCDSYDEVGAISNEAKLPPLAERVLGIISELAAKTCEWVFGNDPDFDVWKTGCDDVYCFIEGGPKENKIKFCPYCGGKVALPEKGTKP